MPTQDTTRPLDDFLADLIARPAYKENDYELLFDSFAQSSAGGTRTSVISARQLLFRIGAVFVDVEVDRESNSDRASIIGQMLDSSNPGHPPSGVPIALLDRGRKIASTASNDNGEFQFQFAMKSNLKLSVGVNRGRRVYLPITPPPAKANPVAGETAGTDTRSLGILFA